MTENPIKKTGSRLVHQGRLVRMRVDDVVLPRGTRAEYEVVRVKDGASTLALDHTGDVWLVREWKYAVDRPSLEVISGGIEAGEEPLEAARRELREEAGLAAAEWIPMGVVDPFTTMVQCANHLFLARRLSHVGWQPEEGEQLELVHLPLAMAVDLVMRGEIRHATSCVLLLKVAEWLRNAGAAGRAPA